MFNPISILSTTGNIATKLYGFYHLTTDDVKNGIYEAATAKNIAYASIAVTAAGSIIAYPPTRMALCTFLSLSYTMTTITLQLIIMGLYLLLAGTQGLTSAAGSLTSLLGGMGSSATKGGNVPSLSKVSQLAEEASQLNQAWNAPQSQPSVDDALFEDALRDMEAQENLAAPLATVHTPKIQDAELLNPANWVEEYGEVASNKSWVQEFMPEAKPVLNAAVKHATDVGIWVTEFESEQMVAEFLQTTQKSSGSMGKKLLVGAGATAAAVFTAYQLYKTVKEVREMTKDEPDTTGTSYANFDSDTLNNDFYTSYQPQIWV